MALIERRSPEIPEPQQRMAGNHRSRPPFLLHLKGPISEAFSPERSLEAVAEARLLDPAEIASAVPIAGEEAAAPVERIPTVFTTVKNHPRRTGVRCWGCHLNHDNWPYFVPNGAIQTETGVIEFSIGGSFCSAPCAARWARDTAVTAHAGAERIRLLCMAVEVITGVYPVDIPSAADYSEIVLYGGPKTVSEYVAALDIPRWRPAQKRPGADLTGRILALADEIDSDSDDSGPKAGPNRSAKAARAGPPASKKKVADAAGGVESASPEPKGSKPAKKAKAAPEEPEPAPEAAAEAKVKAKKSEKIAAEPGPEVKPKKAAAKKVAAPVPEPEPEPEEKPELEAQPEPKVKPKKAAKAAEPEPKAKPKKAAKVTEPEPEADPEAELKPKIRAKKAAKAAEPGPEAKAKKAAPKKPKTS